MRPAFAAIVQAMILTACTGPVMESGRVEPEPKALLMAIAYPAPPGMTPAQIVDVSQVGDDGTVRIALLAETREAALALKPYLYIFVGQTEGQALFRAMHGFETPRPMTHNLLTLLMKQLKGSVARAAITDIADGVFLGRLVIRAEDGSEKTVDCRPSDALPLAVLFSAPVFVSEELIRKAGSPSPPDEYEEEPRLDPEPPRLWDSV